MSGTHPLRVVTVIGTAVATLAVAAMAPSSAAPTAAQGRAQGRAQEPQEARTLVTAGLDNPRHLAFDRRGRLYVAEAGRGGADPCITGIDGNSVCYGTTGAVSRIGRRGGHRRVASGFPSLADGGGDYATGPTDIFVGKRGRYVVSIGLAQNPTERAGLPQAGRRFMGTLASGRFHRGRFVFADLAGYEAEANPDRGLRNSDPGGFIRRGQGFVVADAGGNDVLAVSRRGKVSAVRTFGTRPVPPIGAGPPLDMESVPSSVARGRNGVVFVSELTGFPFPVGSARIYRIAPGQRTQVFATGLTNVTDLTVYRGQLYAVQLADEGLLASGGLPSGSLVRVVPGGRHVTVADNLQSPYGVAIRRGKAYVTTCSSCAGEGGVLKIPLFR